MAPSKWIVVADERIARLLLLEPAAGMWHARQSDELVSKWEDYHEHHRPHALDHKPSATATEHFSSGFSESQRSEERERFARDVIAWIEKKRRILANEQLIVFAAPGLFGALRKRIGKLPFTINELELTTLSAHELAEHPAVRRSLGITESSSVY